MFFFLVLDEILSVLLSKQLICELMKPQPPYTHQKVREIIEEVAQSSIMRLDTVSMNKLWELITMVFKWQVTMSDSIIKLTARHLLELDDYIVKANTRLQLQRVQNIINNFGKIFTQNEQSALREEVLNWLKIFKIRVSLLLRMGLQNDDCSFIINNTSEIAQDMLNNLGENIYIVTENGRILQRTDRNTIEKSDNPEMEVNELKIFADQIIGEKRKSGKEKVLTLSINKEAAPAGFNIKNQKFDVLEISKNDNRVSELLKELNVTDEAAAISLKDDLLDMIENDSS